MEKKNIDSYFFWCIKQQFVLQIIIFCIINIINQSDPKKVHQRLDLVILDLVKYSISEQNQAAFIFY